MRLALVGVSVEMGAFLLSLSLESPSIRHPFHKMLSSPKSCCAIPINKDQTTPCSILSSEGMSSGLSAYVASVSKSTKFVCFMHSEVQIRSLIGFKQEHPLSGSLYHE